MVCKLSIYNTAVCSTIQTLNFPKAVVPLYTNHLLTTKDLCREDNSNSSEEVQQITSFRRAFLSRSVNHNGNSSPAPFHWWQRVHHTK